MIAAESNARGLRGGQPGASASAAKVTSSPSASAADAIASTSSPAQSVRVPVLRQHAHRADDTDLVTIEEPLEIRLGYFHEGRRAERSLSVTMRTPGDEFDLALGFLLGEGVIESASDVAAVEFCGPPSPDKGFHNTVKVELLDHVRFDVDNLLRHFFTSSSCGVCGKASLDAVRLQIPHRQRPALGAEEAALQGLPEALRTKQAEFGRTGGLHAAAAFDSSGRVLRVREDVGRHNALDKLVGSFLAAKEPPLQGLGVLLSGRASFELIQKAAMTHSALVAAIGPPSNLAIELAAEAGIALVGFLKSSGFNIYVPAQGGSPQPTRPAL